MPDDAEPATPGVGGAAAERLRSVAEVADYLGLTRDRVYDLIRSRQLAAHDVSDPGAARRSYRVTASALADYLTRTQHAPAGADRPGRA